MSQERSVEPDPLANVPVDNTEELDGTWREAPRGWGHSLHKLSPYVGGYPPALAHYFIKRYTTKGDTVFDPFCGGGTTPLEAILNGRKAIANDAFSYAFMISQAKCDPLNHDEFIDYLATLQMSHSSIPEADLEEPSEDIELFFHEDTLDELLRIRHLLKDNPSSESVFMKALVCGILHGPSSGFLSLQTKDTFSGTPDYVREYIEENDISAEYRNVFDKIEDKYESVISDGLPDGNADIHQGDARNIDVAEGSVDFVLTSPPYMHVLDYTWNNWLRLWWLDREKDDERDDLVITSDNKKYKNFINESLRNLHRILSQDSRAVIVIGDVRKHRKSGAKTVRVGKIIAEEARSVGFDVERVIDDAYGVEKRSYTKFNEIKYETEPEDETDEEELIDRCIILNKGSPDEPNKFVPPW